MLKPPGTLACLLLDHDMPQTCGLAVAAHPDRRVKHPDHNLVQRSLPAIRARAAVFGIEISLLLHHEL
jgi:hypothetical protein